MAFAIVNWSNKKLKFEIPILSIQIELRLHDIFAWSQARGRWRTRYSFSYFAQISEPTPDIRMKVSG